jgi:hypothetical protein
MPPQAFLSAWKAHIQRARQQILREKHNLWRDGLCHAANESSSSANCIGYVARPVNSFWFWFSLGHLTTSSEVLRQLHRSRYGRGNFKLTKSIYVHLPCWQQIWSTRERPEVRFKEVKRLRRRFNDSETIQFPTIHLTQNFIPESDSESPPESTWSVYSEPYYSQNNPTGAG